MRGKVFALIVHERADPCETLKVVLRQSGVDTFSVASCAEARHLLEQTQPQLLFTDTKLPDGTWIDVLNLAEDAAAPICAILVGPSNGPELTKAALSYGAFDCLSPPFETQAISNLLQRAMDIVQAGRERHARSAVA